MKRPEERRTKRIMLNVTPAEMIELRLMAMEYNTTLSNLIYKIIPFSKKVN